MKVFTRILPVLLAGSTILLGAGCSGSASPQAPSAQQAPAAPGQPSPAAQQQPGPASQQDPSAQGSAGQGSSAPVGYLQLGHLAPNAPSFDGYFARFGQDGTLVGSGGYGNLSPYMALPPGRYVWSMRPTDSPPNSPLTLTKLIEVKPGESSTVVLFNTGPQGALQGMVEPDDTSTPPAGMAKVRVVQGAAGGPVSLTVGDQPASELAYGAVTPYRVVPAGQLAVRTSASDSPLTVDLAPGSLTTVLVTRSEKGVQLAPVTDKVTGSPLEGRTPSGANTGSGGLAATSDSGPLLAGLAGGGALLALIGGALVLARRRSA